MRLIRPLLVFAVLAVAFAVLPTTPAAHARVPPPPGWYIDLDSILIQDPLNDRGDNVAMAVVAFRTRFGLGGTWHTDVWVDHPFRVLCFGMRAGNECPVTDTAGAVPFGQVNQPTLADIAATGPQGANTPEIIGTIQYLTYVDQPDTLTERLPLDALQYWIGIYAGVAFQYLLDDADSISHYFVQLLKQVEEIAPIPGALPPYITGMIGVAPELRTDVNLGILARHPTTLLRTGAAALERRNLTFVHSNHSVRYYTGETVHHRP